MFCLKFLDTPQIITKENAVLIKTKIMNNSIELKQLLVTNKLFKINFLFVWIVANDVSKPPIFYWQLPRLLEIKWLPHQTIFDVYNV